MKKVPQMNYPKGVLSTVPSTRIRYAHALTEPIEVHCVHKGLIQ